MSFVTSAGGDTKDPYCGYTSFVTSAGGQTNHSPQSEGVARTTGGTRRRPLIDPLWVGLENQHLGSDLPRGEVVMRGVPIGSPSRSGYALRLGARIRPTALRSFLPKPESETSLSSVVTSVGGDTKDPYCGYSSFVTSAGGQTNHSPQSEGVARTTGGTRRRPLIDPLWVGLGTANTFDSIEGSINWRIAVR